MHGPEKIFFASDFPLPNSENQVKDFLAMGLNKEIEEKILWKNTQEKILMEKRKLIH